MTTSHGQNDLRYDDATKFTRELGRNAASGDDAMPLMALHLVKQAADGVFDTEPNKHGKGIDDAKHQFGIYADSRVKKSVHDFKGDSLKTQVSKARAFIKMGVMTTCNPVEVAERTQAAWNKQHAIDPKSVKSAYHAYLKVAQTQQTADTDLSDEQIAACVAKAEAKEQTVESKLTAAKKILDDLIVGENGLKDQNPLTVAARTALDDRLAAFALERETAADQAEILRLEAKGYKLTPTGESAAFSALEVDRGLVGDEMAEAMAEAIGDEMAEAAE